MDLDLNGKRALVTGSSSGLGEAIAKALAREGVHVAVHGRNRAEVARVRREISEDGGVAHETIGDLAADDQADNVVADAFGAMGGVDILINNAGAAPSGDLFDQNAAQIWNETYNANVVSMVRLAQKIVPDMKGRSWGRIVNLSSITGMMPPPGFVPHYPATKAAVQNFTVSLAKTVAGTGVTVNAVSPSLVRTSATEPWFRAWADQNGWGDDWSAIEQHIVSGFEPNAIGRLCRPDEVAAVVVFLASSAASFINATNIRVDGGANPTVN